MNLETIKAIKDTDNEFHYTLKTLTDPSLPYDPLTNPYIPFSLIGATATYKAGLDFETPLISLTVGNGISIDTVTSTITLQLKPTLTFDSLQLFLNSQLNVTVGGQTIAILYGTLKIYNSLS